MAGTAPKADPAPTLRDHTRRAVRTALVAAAEDLFLRRGYEQTTIDDIAEAVGMSRRSYFRYFSSKDDLVVGKYDLCAERLARDLAARPLDEPVWYSLRRVFDHVVSLQRGENPDDRVVAMERVVRSTPGLKAAYLEKLDQMQEVLVKVIVDRANQRGGDTDERDPTVRAFVGAAFACLLAAWSTTIAEDDSAGYGPALDAAMDAVGSGWRALDTHHRGQVERAGLG